MAFTRKSVVSFDYSDVIVPDIGMSLNIKGIALFIFNFDSTKGYSYKIVHIDILFNILLFNYLSNYQE
jgi:hypothetical protein